MICDHLRVICENLRSKKSFNKKMKKDISPEERLLRLIKGSPRKGPGQEVNQAVPNLIDSQRSKKLFPSKINPLGFLTKIKSFDIYNLKFANKVLSVLIILSLLYFVLSFVLFRPSVSLKLAPMTADNKIKDLTAPILEPKPYSYYANEINRRDLFQSSVSSQSQSSSSKDISTDITKELSLLGIVRGDKPQAIIEDQKTKKTYFLNIGDSINGLIVESIGEGKVTLDFNGQKIDLFL